MSKKHGRKGGKITKSHSSVISGAEVIVDAAERDAHTKKISLRYIDNGARCRRRKLKFTPINGGLRVTVYQAGPVQEIYIYTDDPVGTQTLLTQAYQRAYPAATIERIS